MYTRFLGFIRHRQCLTEELLAETKLGDIAIPQGVLVSLPTRQQLYFNMIKEHWGEDAKEFNPDRFSQGISKASKDQVSFFPFSWVLDYALVKTLL